MNRTIITIICCLLATSVNAQKKVPNPQGYINDFAGMLTTAQKKSLDSLVRAFEKETTVEIALMTIDDTYAPSEKFDSLVLVTHNNWGVGKKDKDNGVLVAICFEFRKVRISTGYGLEKKLTDDEAGRIINEDILPLYRQGKFYEGTRKGLLAIIKELR
jgi:uncharacterized protein